MPNLFPYTNTHELNLDWVLQVVKDFQTKYTTFDQALADALDAIETAKTGSLEDMQTALTSALETISADLESAQAAISADQASALEAVQFALNSALATLTTSEGEATARINSLYNTLPSSAQDIINRLNILDTIITGNTPESFVWLQGDYIYEEGVTPPTPPAINTESEFYNYRVTSRYMTGVGGRRIRIITDGSIEIAYLLNWRNTPPGGEAGAYVPGQEGLTATFFDILLPMEVTAISIELKKPGTGVAISPSDIPGHIEIQWITDFVSQRVIAPKEESLTANVARETGELFFYEGVLYIALDDIAIGDTIILSGAGANCRETTVGHELYKEIDDIADALSAANSALSGVSSLQSDMTTAQGDITSLESDMSTAQGDITSLESDMSTAQGDITALQGDMTTAQGDITSLENDKANNTGTYNNLIAGNLSTTKGYEEKSAYISKISGGAKVYAQFENDTVIGGTIAWNQLVDTNSETVTMESGHKYFSRISEVESIGSSDGTPISVTGGTDNVIDLTIAFGSTIADYIYSLETGTPGAGVNWIRALFPKNYYAYDAGTLRSVQTSDHVMRNSDNEIIENYPLDSSLILRGAPMLDANNNLYYNGDEYESNGTVTRLFGTVDLGSLTWTAESYGIFRARYDAIKLYAPIINTKGWTTPPPSVSSDNFPDKSIRGDNSQVLLLLRIKDSAYDGLTAEQFKAAMNGVYIVFPLATATTETANTFANPQKVDIEGKEQYVDAGNRDVAIPVGSNTWYFDNLKEKLERLPWNLDTIAPVLDDFIADTNLVSNDFRIINNTLYKITASIIAGQTIAPGTNAQKTTVCEILTAMLNA